MVGIGILVGGVASSAPDLEATLVQASIEGMERDDLRVLAVRPCYATLGRCWSGRRVRC